MGGFFAAVRPFHCLALSMEWIVGILSSGCCLDSSFLYSLILWFAFVVSIRAHLSIFHHIYNSPISKINMDFSIYRLALYLIMFHYMRCFGGYLSHLLDIKILEWWQKCFQFFYSSRIMALSLSWWHSFQFWFKCLSPSCFPLCSIVDYFAHLW